MKKVIEWRKANMAKQTRTYGYKTINKEDAKAFVSKIEKQRPIDPAWVAGLTRTMDGGLWDCGGGRSPIALDKDGRPINGQHRLAAFIGSKLDEITFLFVTGCDPEDISGFDTDAKARTARLTNPEMPFAAREIARLTAYDKLTTGNLRIKNTHAVLSQLFQKSKKQCEWAADVMPSPAAQGRAAYMSAFMYAHRADPEFADTKARAWANGGSGLPHVVIKLRDEALRRNSNGGTKAINANIRTTLKTLNALAFMHQKKEMPARLNDGLGGLRYFSGLLNDGAAKRWEQAVLTLGAE